MKKIFAAAVAAVFVSGAAYAGGLAGTPVEPTVFVASPEVALSTWDFVGNAQYEFKSETFETTLGVQYTYENFAAVLSVTGADTPLNSFDFVGADLTAVYSVNANFDIYGGLSVDNNWDHDATTVGVAFRF